MSQGRTPTQTPGTASAPQQHGHRWCCPGLVTGCSPDYRQDTCGYSQCWPPLPVPRYEGHIRDNIPLDRDRPQNAITHTVCPERAWGTPTQHDLSLFWKHTSNSRATPAAGEARSAPRSPCSHPAPCDMAQGTWEPHEKEPRVPKPLSWGCPWGKEPAVSQDTIPCPGCGTEREEVDGQHTKNSSLFCSFMACD